MKKITLITLLAILSSCASGSKNEVVFQDEVTPGCQRMSVVSSSGFSIIPGIGKMVAKSMLAEKAREFNSNMLIINNDEGFFYSKLEATGYQCADLNEGELRT